NPALVPNAKIIVEGGWVYTETGTVAIQTTGVNGDVTVLGGKITATTGFAIKATRRVEISGGFVFAYGTSIGAVVSATNTNFPTGSGVVTAWNKAILNPIYIEGSNSDLVVVPPNPSSPPNNVYWHRLGLDCGIKYGADAAEFFILPVTVELFETETLGLIFDISQGKFYIGSTVYEGQATNWSWNAGDKILTLTSFEWVTSSPVALTITNGTDITIDLVDANTFISTGAATNAAGILSNANMTITGTGTLNASAAAGMGINCGTHSLTMESGIVNAASGNRVNTHGLNVNTLTIIGGMLNASSGGLATTGATYGINAVNLIVMQGDGVLTASGNSRAMSNASLTMPGGYAYSKGSRPDGGNANSFSVPSDAEYLYSANNSYVQIQARRPHTLTVLNPDSTPGTGGGSYFAGEIVSIDAFISTPGLFTLHLGPISPTEGPPYQYPTSFELFKSWISNNGGSFTDADSKATTFVMPDNDVDLSVQLQTAYKLWVSGGGAILHVDNPSLTDLRLGYYLEGDEIPLVTFSSYGATWYFKGWEFAHDRSTGDGHDYSFTPQGDEFDNPYSTHAKLTMPAGNAIIQGLWLQTSENLNSNLYDLTVIGGVGNETLGLPRDMLESIYAGTWVTIVADPPPSPTMEFDRWAVTVPAIAPGYPGAFIDINASTTQFIMGEGNITITALYRDILYELIVVNGTGGGWYPYGAEVVIEATPPQARYEFASWATGDGGALADDMLMQTVYTMPANNATVVASYEEVEFELLVENGSGSGVYRPGDRIVITTVPIPGEALDMWITHNGGTFDDESSAETIFVMPGNSVTVTALFTQAISPLINGQTAGTDSIGLVEGYAAFTKSYVVTGKPAPTLDVAGIAGATVTDEGLLSVPAGLAVGTYTAVITAQNTEGTSTMTVTVEVRADDSGDDPPPGGDGDDEPDNKDKDGDLPQSGDTNALSLIVVLVLLSLGLLCVSRVRVSRLSAGF
ncbi:MAG: carbohydrate-binding domain-containing protein, partial [Coriobacteriia bacterium]|nr:carbohydrate-binding domain-containing protein [Coriobacteriia bacterium]